MSHGGGGGGFGGGGGHHGGGHHGGGHHGGGEPDSSASWNMAYVGDKRNGARANFNPFPIFIGLFVFSVMILPFVMDWNEPHLQRLLIGHDLTQKEIEHNNAINQALAGAMRQHTEKAFGSEIGGMMIPEPEAPSGGSAMIGQPASPSSIPDNQNGQQGGGLAGFSISAAAPSSAPAAMSSSMAPGQQYLGGGAPAQASGFGQPVPPTVGFSNQRFVSQPSRGAYFGPSAEHSISTAGIDYHAPRHRVVVDR